MAVLKGKLSWSMAAWLFAWLGLAVIPRLRVSLSLTNAASKRPTQPRTCGFCVSCSLSDSSRHETVGDSEETFVPPAAISAVSHGERGTRTPAAIAGPPRLGPASHDQIKGYASGDEGNFKSEVRPGFDE
ncbi:hypothetical protein BGZ57DRAFT_847722 [Hyaloscypha finlandica]|nr:hypothetical protein BGZ57DRAFT_847722 [Hyaloscypha finlandica]